jgi:hypothetical protein
LKTQPGEPHLNVSTSLCAYGYTASVQAQRSLFTILMSSARHYLWRHSLSWLPGGKRLRIYSINLMRLRHPTWFRQDLERLFGLLAARTIRPRPIIVGTQTEHGALRRMASELATCAGRRSSE